MYLRESFYLYVDEVCTSYVNICSWGRVGMDQATTRLPFTSLEQDDIKDIGHCNNMDGPTTSICVSSETC